MPSPDENNLPGTPWDIRVDQLMQENNFPQEAARDWVIADWLYKGNTTPFTEFVLQGHIPSNEIIKYVALMMNSLAGTDDKTARVKGHLRTEVCSKPRRRRRTPC